MSDFAIPACANCGHAIWPPRLACAVCGAAEWTEVPVPTGTLLDVTEAPGYDGTSLRLGTVRLAVPFAPQGRKRNSGAEGIPPAVPFGAQDAIRNSGAEGDGPPVIAAVDGDVAPGDAVELELVDGALRARAPRAGK
ncbi:MAG TPA: zinc ribbon domain-containing protein [Solirubrobacterales bacterium]|nr:zinc ribbon domain-containing protein [Solirubrobacterales bacterium]